MEKGHYQEYDVAVIGAGPAGSTCAKVTHSAGHKTVVIEKEVFPRRKVCAGLVTGEGTQILNKIYPDLPDFVYASPKVLEGPKVFFNTTLVINSKHLHHNFNRASLDQWLADNSKAQVLYGARANGIETLGDRVRINYIKNGNNHTLFCKWLVGADGGDSTISRTLYPDKLEKTSKGMAKQFYYKGSLDLDKNYFYLFMTKTSFFRWAIYKDDTWLIGTGCNLDQDIDTLLKEYLDFLVKNFKLSGEPKGEDTIFFNDLWIECPLGYGNIMLTGEAAGFWGRAGDGIWFGMESGRICGESIVEAANTNQKAIDIYEKKIAEYNLKKRAYLGHNNAVKIHPFHRKVQRA